MSFPRRILSYWTRPVGTERWTRRWYDPLDLKLIEMHHRIDERAAEIKRDLERVLFAKETP